MRKGSLLPCIPLIAACSSSSEPAAPPAPEAATACAPADMGEHAPPGYHGARGLHQARCTESQIERLYGACLAHGATPESCAAFGRGGATEDRQCAACVLTREADVTWGPVVQMAGTVRLNVAGCVELLGGEPGGRCAREQQAAELCAAEACAACEVRDDASFARFVACGERASEGACSAFTQRKRCMRSFEQGPAARCFEGRAFKELYLSIAPVFCGRRGL